MTEFSVGTLRELEYSLQFHDDDHLLNVELTGEWYSYRGYYDVLAIEYKSGGQEYSTVGHLKAIIKDAMNVGEMEGYKGGEFSIDEQTAVCFCDSPRHTAGLFIQSVSKSFSGVNINAMEED